ncbi:SDR family oxidoreductase [Rhizobium sp. P38BS-XIX]|uniref:SDR family oxidoreductase n=1 Tax=Rhizobium sp. P38BS-XIX TaxID=2726740 RepID=UPI0014575730|nr:SDR family oxidoreductase [Rhizobium sp. P38BS-XIX]NLS01599.1 SDR family oxidoreductase [Rhizobium sp. P38BS-XIX]
MSKTVLITGTSSGYGLAIAQHFLTQGWNVAATMRKPSATAFAKSDRLKVFPLDVTDTASIDETIAQAKDHFGGIDALINNAGIGLASAFEATPDETIRELFDTNTFGVFATCRAIIPLMRKQGGGTIVNVTSSAAIAPTYPLVSVYVASKCAIEGFTESVANELLPFNIRAKLVEPGLAPTTRFGANAATRMDGLIPHDYQDYAQRYFQKMAHYPTDYCKETEVAAAAFEAASDGSNRLRYPAGADSELLASLRWPTSEEAYLTRMRELFVP